VLKRVTVVLTAGFLVSHRWNARQSSYRPLREGRSYMLEYEGCDRIQVRSIADSSDCPTIGPDCECCRCIGQALEQNIERNPCRD